jgi:arylsulfatase A-like enzyme
MFSRFLNSPWPYFVGAALLTLVAIATQFELNIPSRPRGVAQDVLELRNRDDLNVIFVLIDTLRADRLSIYGYPRATSPVIDDLARHGILFRRTIAQSSWTKSSMASIWTASYPSNNGILRYNHALPEDALLPAEMFKQAGFRTVGIWRNGWVAPNFGFAQGFDIYLNPKPGRQRAMVQRLNPTGASLSGTDEDLVTAAGEFLDNFGHERFFLYLHMMDLHQYVYDDAAADFGTSYSDVYDRSINWTDRLLHVLVSKIDDLDLLRETLIVIASDHGEAFLEHGREGHARNLYGEVTEVPFIVVPPFILEEGIVVDELVSNLDIWPTILDMVGMPPLPGADGRSLVPLILDAGGVAQDGSESLSRPAFAQLDRRWGQPKAEPDPIVSVTHGHWRMHKPLKGDDGAAYFDLAADPDEQNRLEKIDAETQAQLNRFAEQYLDEPRTPWGGEVEEVELSELMLNQLRALGYVVK